jgi:hypothetical protein
MTITVKWIGPKPSQPVGVGDDNNNGQCEAQHIETIPLSFETLK